MNLTPHGPGFSFLDAFTVSLPGREGRGRKWLDPKLSFFADHFPGEPMMPGVLLIECSAQASGALLASTLPPHVPPRFVLAQVSQFKIQKPVFPGETIEIIVTLENIFGLLAQFGATLRVDDVEVARGNLVLRRNPEDSPGSK